MDKVQHFEIPAKNKEKMKEFYSKVFGWKFIDIPDMNYTMIHTAKTDDKGIIQENGAINGGMTTEDSVETPILVVSAENAEEKIKQAKESGATVIMEPMQVSDMGIYARIKDVEGNIIGIWQDVKKE